MVTKDHAKTVARAAARKKQAQAQDRLRSFQSKHVNPVRRYEEAMQAEPDDSQPKRRDHGSKFVLADATTVQQSSTAHGSALGAATVVEPELPEQDTKRNRREAFEDVITTTRRARADAQQQRAEKQRETDQLDNEFHDLMHLLPKRNKMQEEVDEFATLGKPEVRALLREHAAARNSSTGRKFVLGGGTLAAADAGAEEPSAPQPLAKHAEPADDVDNTDDFDLMMGKFRMEAKRALTSERVMTDQDEAVRNVQQELLQSMRERAPAAAADVDVTRAEWVQRGGDDAYQMEGDTLGAVSRVNIPRTRRAIDELFEQLEQLCAAPSLDAKVRASGFSAVVGSLWQAAVRNKREAEDAFKLLLVDMQRCVLKRERLTTFHKASLLALFYVFPATDFRHSVTTPALVLLASLVSHATLNSLEDARDALFFATTLLHGAEMGCRYAGEVVVLAGNVIGLQAAKAELQAVALSPMPILKRAEESLLVDVSNRHKPVPLTLFDEACHAGDVAAAAYRLLQNATAIFKESPSIDGMLCGFLQCVAPAVPFSSLSPELQQLHRTTVEVCVAAVAESTMTRTPLAMRTFRPRPLRQYEPLLADDTPSEKKERQVLKQQLNDDRKRVVRAVAAEAAVERRDKERAQTADAQRRERKYHELMGELQQQQSIMKTADTLMAKSRQKRRSSTNAVPSKKSDE